MALSPLRHKISAKYIRFWRTSETESQQDSFRWFFFMLQSKSEKTYSAAFQLLNDFAVQNGAELDPEVILTDYEKAAINAVESVFPESRTQGCFFPSMSEFLQANSKIRAGFGICKRQRRFYVI